MSFDKVEQNYQDLGLESIPLFDKLKELPLYFRSFSESVKGFVDSKLGDNNLNHFKPLIIQTWNIDKWIRTTNYITLKEIDVYVPPGLKTDLLSYAKTLEEAHNEIVSKTIVGALKPSLKWVATVLSDPEKLVSVRDYYKESGITIDAKKIDIYRNKIGEHFSKDKRSDKLKYDVAFKRNADLKELAQVSNKLNEQLAKIDPREILSIVDAISSGVDTLIAEIDNENNDYQVSGKTIKDMSDTLYSLAQIVEFYSGFCMSLITLTQAISDNERLYTNIMTR